MQIPPLCPQVIHVPWHPSVGVCIGVLGLVAAVLPFLREKVGRKEKSFWVVLLTGCLTVEVWSIRLEDIKRDREQEFTSCENLRAFKMIADGLRDDGLANQAHYTSTISRVDGVLTTTQNVARLARENLQNVTGGNSYAYVYPKLIIGSLSDYILEIHNMGEQVLTGVTVKTSLVISGVPQPGVKGIPDLVTRENRVLNIGTLAPNTGEKIPEVVLTPELRADGTATYRLLINAQNKGVQETLFFRRAVTGRGLAYKLFVLQGVPRSRRRKGDVFDGREWARYVKVIDWTDLPTSKLAQQPVR